MKSGQNTKDKPALEQVPSSWGVLAFGNLGGQRFPQHRGKVDRNPIVQVLGTGVTWGSGDTGQLLDPDSSTPGSSMKEPQGKRPSLVYLQRS